MKMQTKLNITALNTAVAEAERKQREAASQPQPPPPPPPPKEEPKPPEPTVYAAEEIKAMRDNLNQALPRIVHYGEIALNAIRESDLSANEVITSLQGAIYVMLQMRPDLAESYPIMQAVLQDLIERRVQVVTDSNVLVEVTEEELGAHFPMGTLLVSDEVKKVCTTATIKDIFIDHGHKRWGHISEGVYKLNTNSIEKAYGAVLSLWGEAGNRLVCVTAFKDGTARTKLMFLREDIVVQQTLKKIDGEVIL